VPLQRLGTLEEYGWICALLAGELGPAFNGSVVTLDGAADNWWGPWPPGAIVDEGGAVPTEARRPAPDAA
jgi:citronellol/citronellal dehydrogenase